MSLSGNITTISESLDDIKDAIEAKGVTVSGNITTYAQAIADIPSGGGEFFIENQTTHLWQKNPDFVVPAEMTNLGSNVFKNWFDAVPVNSIDVSAVETINGSGTFYNFANSAVQQIDHITFDNLESINIPSYYSIFYNMHANKFYFPKLSSLTANSSSYLYSIFSNNEAQELHFNASRKSYFENLTAYDNRWGCGSNCAVYFDIDGATIQFNVTPSNNNNIYLNGELLSGTSYTGDLTNKNYLIYNPAYCVETGTVTGLVANQTTNVNATLTNVGTQIDVVFNLAPDSIVFEYNGVVITPSTTATNTYTIIVPANGTITYTATKDGYGTLTGTTGNSVNLTFTQQTTDLINIQPYYSGSGFTISDASKIVADSLFGSNNEYLTVQQEYTSYTFMSPSTTTTLTLNASISDWGGMPIQFFLIEYNGSVQEYLDGQNSTTATLPANTQITISIDGMSTQGGDVTLLEFEQARVSKCINVYPPASSLDANSAAVAQVLFPNDDYLNIYDGMSTSYTFTTPVIDTTLTLDASVMDDMGMTPSFFEVQYNGTTQDVLDGQNSKTAQLPANTQVTISIDGSSVMTGNVNNLMFYEAI